ncbi:MAG: complex I subunit 1 family protein [Candidatus Diapherotrites archaeon]
MTLYMILQALLIMSLAIVFALLFNGVERKIVARMQARIGPPLLQPFFDLRKLLIKENIVPDTAIKWIFNISPIMAFATALVFFLYIPFLGMNAVLKEHADMILVLYLLALPPLFLAIGGFASGSSYASIGAQRELVLMISYEFVLAALVFSSAWLYSTKFPDMPVFSMDIENRQSPWNLMGPIGFLGLLLLLISALAVMPAKAGKLPYDISEAKTEIADGVLVEYSGINLALLYITQALRTLGFATFIVFLFFPNGLKSLSFGPNELLVIANIFLYLINVFLVMFFSAFFVSAVTARLKVDQAAGFYILRIFLLAILGLLLVTIDITFGGFIYAFFH